MPPTSSPNADQLALKPPDERVADFSSLHTWVKSGLDAAMYKGLLGATYIYVWEQQTWKRILNWTLAPHVGEVKPGQGKDRAYVLSLADAFIVKHLAQFHAALTSAVVTDPKFKAGFASFVVKYRLQEQREQRAGLKTGFAAWKQAARKQAARTQAIAAASAAWTQSRERANAMGAIAAFGANAAEKRAAAAVALQQAIAVAVALQQGIAVLAEAEAAAQAIAVAAEAEAAAQAIAVLAEAEAARQVAIDAKWVADNMKTPETKPKSVSLASAPRSFALPHPFSPPAGGEPMTRPDGAVFTSYRDKRLLSTGFFRKVKTIELALPKKGEAPYFNKRGVAVTPGPEIGAPMESSLQLRYQWQDTPSSATPLGPKK